MEDEIGETPSASRVPARGAEPLPGGTVWLFAVVSALTVANLYYHQPLLGEIARDFGASQQRAGYISTVTQVGYALGLLLFVPLGDVRERRGLFARCSWASRRRSPASRSPPRCTG